MRCSSGKARADRHAGCDTPALSPDSLLPVGINHHTQHIVACDELVPCFLQYGEIELIVAFIPLKQDVTGDAASQ